jgi:hypothetical protein
LGVELVPAELDLGCAERLIDLAPALGRDVGILSSPDELQLAGDFPATFEGGVAGFAAEGVRVKICGVEATRGQVDFVGLDDDLGSSTTAGK